MVFRPRPGRGRGRFAPPCAAWLLSWMRQSRRATAFAGFSCQTGLIAGHVAGNVAGNMAYGLALVSDFLRGSDLA